ncbi:hypothetical protein HAZT_HAZT006136 [Hyalella azteca]|uniref:NADH dehydrogenase [ubiquinone] 1 beta subcomplex subunit 8, mitochondrial n=1 Tax=Hyalella azteca TaxID=294128 RepID=A0A6A0H1J3_HYAAZ|nr:NADH dehydrogenase [ubiquinone] 1 beta subcomplex subunit 8, mitochondrial [Hyalella azteca]KAA0195767.1 hypothetical protein HAZT_HAZT006136 [Hyalella azteca]
MAGLTRSVRALQSATKIFFPLVQGVRSAAHWNDDWKPGPYPKTEAERIAAARKYGLLPEDYEPYPDDGWGYGDYPKLPIVSAESRDPYEDYDFPEYRRNFGEPVHADFDIYGLDRIKHEHTDPQTPLQQLGFFVCIVGGCSLMAYLCHGTGKYEMKPPQIPYSGEVHYTFEKADSQ